MTMTITNMIDNVIGGVSPLKKKLLITGGKQYRGGTKRKSKGTKGKKSGGFGRSTATHNPQGYTKFTRFKVPEKKQFPRSGGGDNTSNPPPQKPYTIGPDGLNLNFKDMFGDFNFSNTSNNNNINQQSGFGLEEEETSTPSWTEITKTKPKTGNEFKDNCYNKDGSKKTGGHIYYSELKKMRILCKWGGKSDGSFDYTKPGTETKTVHTGTTKTTKRRSGKGGGNYARIG